MPEIDEELFYGLRDFQGLLQRKLKEGGENDDNEEGLDELSHAKLSCPPSWGENLESICFSEKQIQNKVKELAAQISKDYSGKEFIAVGLLTGAVCFMTDLLKYVRSPYVIDFIACSSYGKGTVSKGSPVMQKDMFQDPAGKHILLIEDIIDTGGTLKWLKQYLSGKNCASIKIACLLDKKARRDANNDVHIDYKGFVCPNSFVVGYGMDYAGHYRCLPFIGVLKPEVYEK